MITPLQQAAIREVERMQRHDYTLRPGELDRYAHLLQAAVYPPDIEERIVREDGTEWRTL